MKDLRDIRISWLIAAFAYFILQNAHGVSAKDPSTTEAGFCEVCEKEKHSQLNKMREFGEDLADKTKDEEHPGKQRLASEKSSADEEAMKKHLAREKDRVLKRIEASECQVAKADEDDEDSPDDDMQRGPGFGSGADETGPVAGGAGGRRGGKSGSDLGRSGLAGNALGDIAGYKKMFAGNLEYLDDIQDALDEKAATCQKQAKRQKSKTSSSRLTSMGGVNSNSMMSSLAGNMGLAMGGANMMGNYGMNSMMGNSFSMGPGGSFMGGNGSVMGPMAMMNQGGNMMASLSMMNPATYGAGSMSSMYAMNSLNGVGPWLSRSTYNPYMMNSYNSGLFGISGVSSLYGGTYGSPYASSYAMNSSLPFSSFRTSGYSLMGR